MNWHLVVALIVAEDIRKAVSYYQEVAPQQVGRFLGNVRTAIRDLNRWPYASAPHRNGLRRKSVKAFPYSVWADLDEDTSTVAVVAVLHDNRDPRLIDERAESFRDT